MYDPDLHTWDEDGERLERDAEIDAEPDHYRTFWIGIAGGKFFSTPACGCGNRYLSENALNNHLKRELNP